jgi:hypothetical protein
MSVGKALKKGNALATAVKAGKQALQKGDRDRVEESPAARVVDSLDLDTATRDTHSEENRWDYLLGTTRADIPLIAVEVHPANAREVKVVIAKKRAAEELLRSSLVQGGTVRRWYWIASGKTVITRGMPEARRLNAAGIRLVGSRLKLDDES